ncbi:hypothetical protein FF098_016010 [Parvularcula flava]|uniref:Uncharacterized protein n=1 Tax=Aquisalinus luteolus TaxID=1566827 RepID=A0A8J3ES53_9PROT|nr:hypothetical protein [Aquisalinus luteolus]NHK29418.1 hypothetical protein [Aquisalinus luteolus]GGI02008.1 hypothetical protein GCM10011355_34000 [Aquisalinus luteolus]
MSTFGIYLIGYIIFVAGVVWGLSLLGVPPVWLGVVGITLAGLGILTGVGKTRKRDTNTE